MRSNLFVAIALVGLSVAPLAPGGGSQVSKAAVKALEKSLVMPQGAYPLKTYDRYYTIETIEGRSTLVGRFYFGGSAHRGQVYLEPDDLPFFNDGGCGVIHVYASEDGRTIRYAACNGDA